jgi:phosphatidylserine/phosphatidylglycerophosphate/cardiolipin synthase-like enzyme
MTENTNIHSLDNAILGESSGQLLLTGVTECKDAALRLTTQAKRSIYIFSYDLDHKIYNQTDFLEAVKELAIRSEHSQVKILLQHNEKVQREGHRLIQLWRRLTSKIEIRKPDADHIDHIENFLLVDDTGYLHRKLYTDYTATVDFNAKLATRQFSTFFHEVWEQSEPDSELRNLHI